jgi:hypothetical protein
MNNEFENITNLFHVKNDNINLQCSPRYVHLLRMSLWLTFEIPVLATCTARFKFQNFHVLRIHCIYLFIYYTFQHNKQRLVYSTTEQPIPVAAPSRAWVYGRALAGIVGLNPTGGMDVCLLWVFVLPGRGLCDGPIPSPDESYRRRCGSECDQMKINNLDTCCEQVK